MNRQLRGVATKNLLLYLAWTRLRTWPTFSHWDSVGTSAEAAMYGHVAQGQLPAMNGHRRATALRFALQAEMPGAQRKERDQPVDRRSQLIRWFIDIVLLLTGVDRAAQLC